jgi:1-deoxy-D-xylulose-5-phosphate reductoisomerase
MRIPIASALAWPARMDTSCAPLDLVSVGRLDFAAPDEVRFPATALARAAIAEGGARPAQLNAANEIAVAAFLAGRIAFPAIVDTVRRTLDAMAPGTPGSLHDIFNIDTASRATAQQFVDNLEHA